MTVVANGQSTEAHKINAGVPQYSLFALILFLLYINDMSKKLPSSLEPEDDTAMSKYLDDR